MLRLQKNIVVPFLFLFLITIGCNDTPQETPPMADSDSLETTTETTPTKTEEEKVKEAIKAKEEISYRIQGTYQNCTFYAGATDYYFERTDNQEAVSFRVQNEGFESPNAIVPTMPKDMLESSDTLDGIPGPNPSFVGQPFQLHYNADSQLIAVKKDF